MPAAASPASTSERYFVEASGKYRAFAAISWQFIAFCQPASIAAFSSPAAFPTSQHLLLGSQFDRLVDELLSSIRHATICLKNARIGETSPAPLLVEAEPAGSNRLVTYANEEPTLPIQRPCDPETARPPTACG